VGKLDGASTPVQVINSLTLAGVQTHNTAANCWTIVNGNIYNVTAWINRHEGGPGVIQGICGIDATTAFLGQHGNQGEPNQALARFLLGPVGS
jgi:cytochrome b involved in lipid metabolism